MEYAKHILTEEIVLIKKKIKTCKAAPTTHNIKQEEIFTRRLKEINDALLLITIKECKYIKKEGSSCSLNNNCTYPNCQEKVYSREEVISFIQWLKEEL